MKPTLRILFDRKHQATDKIPALIQIEMYYQERKSTFQPA